MPPIRGRARTWAISALVIPLALAAALANPLDRTPPIAERLNDQEFWQLAAQSSEPNGFFPSENLTSNELVFQRVISRLVSATPTGRVYLGVGPEQNFTYMAAVKPSLAVIFDIRRGNLQLQLMYKAIFELSSDRADFVAMLFSKPRTPSVAAALTVDELFAAFEAAPTSEALFELNLQRILDQLTTVHRLPLGAEDLKGIEDIYRAFAQRGFAVRPEPPAYDELMTATDEDGVTKSFLASEEHFKIVKAMEQSNLVVPVVGDFAGPTAIRAIGSYLKAHRATIGTFYLSNVEQYLTRDGKWGTFCRNVATLPIDRSSMFIRSASQKTSGPGFTFVSDLGSMQAETRRCS